MKKQQLKVAAGDRHGELTWEDIEKAKAMLLAPQQIGNYEEVEQLLRELYPWLREADNGGHRR